MTVRSRAAAAATAALGSSTAQARRQLHTTASCGGGSTAAPTQPGQATWPPAAPARPMCSSPQTAPLPCAAASPWRPAWTETSGQSGAAHGWALNHTPMRRPDSRRRAAPPPLLPKKQLPCAPRMHSCQPLHGSGSTAGSAGIDDQLLRAATGAQPPQPLPSAHHLYERGEGSGPAGGELGTHVSAALRKMARKCDAHTRKRKASRGPPRNCTGQVPAASAHRSGRRDAAMRDLTSPGPASITRALSASMVCGGPPRPPLCC